MIFEIGILKHFAISTGKHLCWSLFLITLQVWRSATLLKRDSNTGAFLWILWIFRNSFFIDHPWWLLLKRSSWTPPQVFYVLMNVLNFSNFLLWEVYPSMVIHHEQCILITYDSAGRERNNFQQLIKINWTKIHF